MLTGPTSHTYFSQRLRLHYVDWGNPEAPPLVLVHGGRDHCRNWDWVAGRLRKDWHVIAPDLRGHGAAHARPEDCSIETYGADIAALLEGKDLHDAVLVGHSMGGKTAMLLACRQPQRVAQRTHQRYAGAQRQR